MKLGIIDYGMGNLKSLNSVFKYHGVNDVFLTSDYKELKGMDKLLLPGVGSFSLAMKNIKKLELEKILEELILVEKKPILGICLGMQLLSKGSQEDGGAEGLGFINAKCTRFNSSEYKVPHVGYNQVFSNFNSKLYEGLNKTNDFYFTHSYKMQSNDDINQSMCEYGEKFIASYEYKNIAGTQFHPELSQKNGLKLIKNFIEIF